MNDTAQDIDSTTGDTVGTGLDPEVVDAAPEVAPEATADDKPEPKEDARDAIYKKRKDQVADQIAKTKETDDMDPIDYTDPDAPAEVEAEPDSQTVEDGAETITITVYGQEQEVPKSVVLQAGKWVSNGKDLDEEGLLDAGKRELQLQKAGDARLAQVHSEEQRLKEAYNSLVQYQKNLSEGLDENGQPIATQAGHPPPSPDVDDSLKERAQKAVEALYSADPEEAAKALTEFATTVADGRGTTATQHADSSELSEKAVEAVLAKRDREKANRYYHKEYADLVKDPVMQAASRAMIQEISQDPEFFGRSLVDVADEAGRRLRERVSGDGGAKADLAKRVARKKASPGSRPASASGRQPAPPKQKSPYPDNKTYIAQMAAARRGGPQAK